MKDAQGPDLAKGIFFSEIKLALTDGSTYNIVVFVSQHSTGAQELQK